MLEYPTKQRLAGLIQSETGCCVSILMPTYQSGPQTRQNSIRFKKLISEAIDRAEAEGASDRMIKHLASLAELEHDDAFWQRQSAALAIYVCESSEQRFKLADSVDEAVFVGEHFLVRPLAADACRETLSRILVLSWDSARLLECRGSEAHEASGDLFPATMDELVAERDPEEQLQFTSHSSNAPRSGQDVAMYHGHGEGEHKIEADRRKYLARVGDRISKACYNDDRPLILLATEEVAGHFTSISGIRLADVIHASPDGLDEPTMIQKIATASRDLVERSDVALQDQLGTALARSQGSTDIGDIVKQAAGGRVDTLLLGNDASAIGRFDRTNREVVVSEEGDVDLVNLAVRETLNAGGQVVQLSNQQTTTNVAAIYRY